MNSNVLWFTMLNINPGNDVMCAIPSLLFETFVYGLVILSIVTLLIIITLSLFCVDDPLRTEEHSRRAIMYRRMSVVYGGMAHVRAPKGIYHWFEKRPFIHRVSFPEHFSKRAESLLDICFLVFPTIVVICILIPTLGFLYNNEYNMEHISTALSIDIIGHQWYWSYEYHIGLINDCFDFSFDSVLDVDAVENANLEVDRRLVIPTDVFLSITITSTDVIHSWAVPQLGIKVDAVPGRMAYTVLSSFMSGAYYGQCSELCGVLHGFMPICVEAVPATYFFEWVCLSTDINVFNVTDDAESDVREYHAFIDPIGWILIIINIVLYVPYALSLRSAVEVANSVEIYLRLKRAHGANSDLEPLIEMSDLLSPLPGWFISAGHYVGFDSIYIVIIWWSGCVLACWLCFGKLGASVPIAYFLCFSGMGVLGLFILCVLLLSFVSIGCLILVTLYNWIRYNK
jgi:heme/copper-type cytochrome/quinol oxidase subunit 2